MCLISCAVAHEVMSATVGIMVNKAVSNNVVYYQCKECSFVYKEKQTAKKCENWCRENKSCNLEIIKKSVKIE